MATEKENKKQQVEELLKIHFGYNTFRPGQEKAIDNVLSGKNTIVIMPTGGGKSLCYQLPALVLEGVTIVVSPLIALMKDQVDSLSRIGIPATFINSSVSPDEALNRLEAVRVGRLKLLYIAPERFYNKDFTDALANIKVSLFAIDEAHCISQWGHDFRPSYMRLREAIEKLGGPVVIALTATATPEVKEDISRQLGFNNPEFIITGFARPNLQFGAIQASDARKPGIVMDALLSVRDKNGIIYVGTRARADELLQRLLENDIEAAVYHAGMEAEDRKWVQDNFMSGKIKIIVATNAFGLGIDKSDIRFVIHYDMPGTIEAYYQEAGRAGRDGKPSFCLLLYSPRDKFLQEFFIKGDNPPPEMILEIYETLINYDTDTVLVTYSELGRMLSESVPDMAVGTALKILEREGYISRSHEKTGNAFIKFNEGLEAMLNAVGSRAKGQKEILEKLFFRFKEEIGKGWETNLEEVAGILEIKKDSLVRLLRKLTDQNLAEYKPPFKGTEIKILKRVEGHKVAIDFTALKEKLRKAYDKLNQIEEYVYHFGCRQSFILNYFGDQSSACKKCDNCLTGNSGYVRKNIQPRREEFGRKSKSKNYSSKFNKDEKVKEMETGEDISKKAKLPTKLTQLETFDLYNKGMSIEGIAKARDLKMTTIVEHLCFLIEKKLPVEIDKLVTKTKQKKVLDAAREVGSDKLTPIKENLGEEISWEEIRLCLAAIKRKKA